MAAGSSLTQGKRYGRSGRRPALLEARKSLLILLQEKAIGAEDLMKRVRCVEAHEWKLIRERRLRATYSAHCGGKHQHCRPNAAGGR